ncbi:MAG: NAD(P)/FAD-dependent oxidoreductase [Anaerolineae bacterium]|nr:NAD(P)/FAD-dependent oxidoreductase [Anaerolineae bacterium]
MAQQRHAQLPYDVIVVGAGPAGLMAAGQAAQMGARTLLLERMDRPARKLRISGKGRGNVTNTAPIADAIARFGPSGRFLMNAFHRFYSAELLALLSSLGVPTLAERGGRVFPASNRAQDVVDALVSWVQQGGATLRTGVRVRRLLLAGDAIAGVQAWGARESERPGERFLGTTVIVATGGASYPATGSTGDGYRLARAAGHIIVPVRPALVPLETAGDAASRLQGLSLRNVHLYLDGDGAPLCDAFGEMLFTASGVSGPIVLALSRCAVDALRAGQRVTLSIDLKPALDEQRLDARLLRDIDRGGKRHYRTLLKGLLPSKLIPLCIEQTGIPAERVAHQITTDERARLRAWLKGLRFEVTGHRGFDEAIVTAGGVDTREIDPRTMASRRVRGLYFAGEVIDVDADTGGYNLQAAFSTGWVAGRAAGAEALRHEGVP